MKPSFIQHAKTTKKSSNSKGKQTSKPAKKKRAKKHANNVDGHVPPPRSRPGRKQNENIEEEEEFDQEPGFFASLVKYTLIITLIIGATILYIQRHDWGITAALGSQSSETQKPQPTPEKYEVLKEELSSQRLQLKQDYLNATTADKKQEVLGHASYVLEETLPQMMRCWLGHPYDFNGTATIPGGNKKIACGYFVSVIMRDAGFDINRIRVAQQPSQKIIRTFVDHKSNYEVKVGTPYPDYVDHILNNYEGIQIVGLDTHVAFVVIQNGELRYIHASAGSDRCVVDEDRDNASSLQRSNYRVISNISRNADVIRRWLLNDKFPTGGVTANIQ